MPTTSAPTTSERLLALVSLLQERRDWPGTRLAERLGVSDRTVRRDVDRLRELGYAITATRGPVGGYRLEAGTRMPPLLVDDDQAVAVAVALRLAVDVTTGVEEAAVRALTTVHRVLPADLRARVDGLEIDPSPRTAEVLLVIGEAIGAREELRFDYVVPGRGEGAPGSPRRIEPHHLVARGGRWYLVGWQPQRADWRILRADRMTPRTPNGPRFTPREVPGGDVATFLATRFTAGQAS